MRLVRASGSLAVAVVASVANQALAQGELVTYSWRFTEVVAGTNNPVGNQNGVLEIGEAARLTLDASFTPSVGSTIIYIPPPPPGVGTVAGLGSVFFDLLGDATAQGTWSFHQRPSGFAGMSGGQLPGGTGRTNAESQQFVLPGQTANASNPVVAVWSMVWTPASYVPRNIQWQSAAALAAGNNHSSLLIQYGVTPQGEPQYVGRFVPGQFGSLVMPIVPAPGVGVSVLGAAMLAATRRRRSR